MGDKLADGSYSGTIPSMMRKVSMKLKTIVSSNSYDEESMSKLSDKVLGCLWNPLSDLIGVKFSFNTSKRKKGVKIGPDLTLKDLANFRSTPQNRRSLLSVCNGIFDPLGLSAPYTIKLKILMKETLTVDSTGEHFSFSEVYHTS